MSMIRYIWFLAFVSVLVSCQDDVEDPINEEIYGYEYFPLEVGKYRTYQVDSIQFDIGSDGLPVSDSSRFYLREEIIESFEDQTGKAIYRIERYRADQLGDPWVIVDVINESREVNQGYRQENNLRFINLVFPLREGTDWDGNAFIPDDMILFIRGESIEFFKNWESYFLSNARFRSISDLRDATLAADRRPSGGVCLT